MSIEENKAIVRRCNEEVFNKKNVSALDEFLASNVVHHSLPPGVPQDRDGFKQFVSVLLAAFPDLHITIEDMIAEGDKVVTRATTSGTHKGEFIGMPLQASRRNGQRFSSGVSTVGKQWKCGLNWTK